MPYSSAVSAHCVWIAEGTVTPRAPLEDVCRTQMHVQLDRPELAAELLEHPFGNHIVAISGRHADRLASWWRWAVGAGVGLLGG